MRTKRKVASVGDQEMLSHNISKEMVGKFREDFPIDMKHSPSHHVSGMRVQCIEGALFMERKRKI